MREDAGTYLATMRATVPLVHNITNYVAMNIAANVLLAAGASPAMVHAREEVVEFAGLAQALSVNIGTLDGPWAEAMEMAAQVMVAAGRPWVLDPVSVGATQFRRDVCARLMALRPTVIRMRRLRPIEFRLVGRSDVMKRRAVGSSSGITRRGPYAPSAYWA